MKHKRFFVSAIIAMLLVIQSCKPSQDTLPQEDPVLIDKDKNNGSNDPVDGQGSTPDRGTSGGNAAAQTKTTPWALIGDWFVKDIKTDVFDSTAVEAITIQANVKIPELTSTILSNSVIIYYFRYPNSINFENFRISSISPISMPFGIPSSEKSDVSVGQVSSGVVSVLIQLSNPKLTKDEVIKTAKEAKFELRASIRPTGSN